ncbi:MAG TPA: acyltransferase [Flavobacteriales bacterium]|nr:acyltransferase [Flavobacteriales bacterium]HNO06146.1 acyltransferase [Flavobacteriales bacterium]
MSGKARISILDGFRAVAIISVMLYHYFSRWIPPNVDVSLYPYGTRYDYFKYGYLGVEFFFVISGFVIFFTLERTKTWSVFWQKRMIRLLPSMVIASFLTLAFFSLFDRSGLFPASHDPKNLIPSVSFVHPGIFNHLFNLDLTYITGSYWSLWPEIQFYMLSSVIFFLDKKRFLMNFMIISIVLIALDRFILNAGGALGSSMGPPGFYTEFISNGFNLITYLPFFCLGILFYRISSDRIRGTRTSPFIAVCCTVIALHVVLSGDVFAVRMIYSVIICTFLVFIYFPRYLGPLGRTPMSEVGESSYFLYLIHENLGVFMIYALGRHIWPDSFLMPAIVIASLSWLSIVYTRTVDMPVNNWLKTRLIGVRKDQG